MADVKFILEKLDDICCSDPYECIFGMYGMNKKGHRVCLAEHPSGNLNEPNQGCIAKQAAEIIRTLLEEAE